MGRRDNGGLLLGSERTSVGGASQGFLEVAAQAGYDLGDPGESQFGMVAYNAAVMLRRLIREASQVGGRRKIGRNEPCPCGSGKKFKKCCIGEKPKTEGDPMLEVLMRPGPPPAAMIPRLYSTDVMSEDTNLLTDLMMRDPDLCKIRFPPMQVNRFFGDRLPPNFNMFSRDDEDKCIDEIANAFVLEYDQTPVFEAFLDSVVRAGQRAQNMSELRALSLGYFLALSESTSGEDRLKGGPLSVAFCRISLFSMEGLMAEVDRTHAPAKTIDQGEDELDVGDNPDDVGAFPDIIKERLPEGFFDALRNAKREAVELLRSVRQGEFPVPLPFPCVAQLILWSALHSKAEPEVEEKGKKEFLDIIAQTETEFCEEDLRLWGQAIQSFLDTATELGSEEEKQARMLLLLLKYPTSVDLASVFIEGSVRAGGMGSLPWEVEILSVRSDASVDSAFLGRYSDRLLKEGYPTLAARVRSCGEQ